METKNAIHALSALAHERRLGLFQALVQAGPEGLAAGDAAAQSGVAFTTASAQLAILSRAGLIRGDRQGRSIIYRAEFGAIRNLIAFLMKDCCAGRADVLAPLARLATSCCTHEKGPKP